MRRGMPRLALLPLLLSSFLLSCGGADRTGGEEISFETEDRVRIVGDLYAAGENARVVVLLHRLGGNRGMWREFAVSLQERGISALAIDLRGHGGSTEQGGETISYRDFGEAEFAAMIHDVEGALRFLRSLSGGAEPPVGIAGASIGANLALTGAAADRGVEPIALLSPGFGYRVPLTSDDMVRYGERPVLIMASRDDGNAASDAMTLDALAGGAHRLLLFDGDDHGLEIVEAHEEARQAFLSWFETASNDARASDRSL